MTTGIIIAIILICVLIHTPLIGVFVYYFEEGENILESKWGTPGYIYNHTKCNIFGCICLTILLILIFPIYYIIYFIYFIFHIGRKEKKSIK